MWSKILETLPFTNQTSWEQLTQWTYIFFFQVFELSDLKETLCVYWDGRLSLIKQ